MIYKYTYTVLDSEETTLVTSKTQNLGGGKIIIINFFNTTD